ncbi:hypothetical protein KIH77_01640 [Bifidobacterium sp. 82T24]|uniref:hypothetical protein n=1 Tax=Bifidobacterium pluvialisilvae TaxID=2834436 RepID=UPI001C5847EB|nr:hypothetical protein [Bifidobacterium pluvialisilvae]MBW3087449.1 hypothetical protein [Bifidobacterium pluvialisilvae]
MKEPVMHQGLRLLKQHIAITITVVAIICAAVISLGNFRPTNLYYSFTFASAPSENSKAVFAFDADKGYPSSSRQEASVTSQQTTIRVDPLNNDSTTLTLTVTGTDVEVTSFIAHTNIRGQHDHVVAAISGSELQKIAHGDKTTFSLSEQQIASVEKKTRFQSETKLFLLTLLLVAYVITILRVTLFRKISIVHYAIGAVGAILVGFFICNLWITRKGLGAGHYPYRRTITLLLLLCLSILAVNYIVGVRGNILAKRAMAIIDYVIIESYAIFQFPLFTKYLGGFPDEQAHISYIAFLKYHGGLIPDFPDMHIYQSNTSAVLMDSPQQFNYLGHPPLYYQIMKTLGGLSVNGSAVTYNLLSLRLLSFCIGLLGVTLIFYIGFTRIKPIPLLHLLFAVAVISPANFVYGLCGVSNDALALLTVSIFILGIIRFYEKRYDIRTYLLIAIGISSTLLTKLTAGMIVAVMSVLIVGYTLLIEKSYNAIVRKEFLISAPIYVFPISYFAMLYAKLHTIQPSYAKFAFDEYVTSGMYVPNDNRQVMAITEYIQYFFTKFLGTWYAIAGHVEVPRNGIKQFDISSIGMLLILLAPLTVFFYTKNRMQKFLSMGTISVLIVVTYQFITALKGFYTNGYPGGIQSRYYLCAMGFFALALIWMVSKLVVPSDETCEDLGSSQSSVLPRLTGTGTLICVGLSTLLICEGLASFLYQADTIKGFLQ